MADDKTDYSKIKTHGGVTVDKDGETHPTSLSDQSRAAHVQALKDERSLLASRVDADGDDGRAKQRLAGVDKQLERFGEKRQARKETATPPAAPPATPPAGS